MQSMNTTDSTRILKINQAENNTLTSDPTAVHTPRLQSKSRTTAIEAAKIKRPGQIVRGVCHNRID
jgi:hypothetical protein